MSKPNPNKKRCKATSRSGEQCRNWAKPGWDICHYHGAGGGAPRGNKNALTTGEHEAIWVDALADDEKELYDQIDTDKIKQLEEEIRLLSIRERRMLQRINQVLEGWEEDDIESKLEAKIVGTKDVPKFNDKGEMRIERQAVIEMAETERTVKKRARLERVQRIEEALTRVQAQKSRLIELKHKIESGGLDEDGSLDDLARAIRESRVQVVSDVV